MFVIGLALLIADPMPQPMAVEQRRDPITDAVTVTATLRDRGERIELTCRPGTRRGVQVRFASTRWLSRGNIFTGEQPLIYRFDRQEPRRLIWNVRDRHATLAGRSRVAAFLRGLAGAERLVIRARDVEEQRWDVTFRLEGVRPAVREFLAACRETRLAAQLFSES